MSYGLPGLVASNLDESAPTVLRAAMPIWPELDLRARTGISPAGWLALRTVDEAESDLHAALTVFRLPVATPVHEIPFVAAAWEEQLQGDDAAARLGMTRLDVEGLIRSPEWRPHWSPNGEQLAFAAILDGPSFDLYVYDGFADTTRRLSDGPTHSVVVGWSPDGYWIVHEEAERAEAVDQSRPTPAREVWATSWDGGSRRLLYRVPEGEGAQEMVGWISPTVFLVTSASAYHVGNPRKVDLATGMVTTVNAGEIWWAALDDQSGTVAFTDLDRGLFLLSPDQEDVRQVGEPEDHRNLRVVRWIDPVDQFFIEGDTVLAIPPSGGSLRSYESETCLPVASPNGRWLAFGDCDAEELFYTPGLRLYDGDGQFVRQVTDEVVHHIAWQPDSLGLFYLAEAGEATKLMQISVPDGNPILLDEDRGWILRLIVREESRRRPTTSPLPEWTPTVQPTGTPQVGLSPSGPWILGAVHGGFALWNLDGTGRRELRIPRVWEFQDYEYSDIPMTSAHPLVAQSLAARVVDEEQFPTNLSLALFDLPATSPYRLIPLLAEGIRNEMGEEIEYRPPSGEVQHIERWQVEDVFMAVSAWAGAVVWSADGEKVAFAAALDGPSADVYVYDRATDEVRRLTGEAGQPYILGWSPDGRWIIYLEVEDIGMGRGQWYSVNSTWAIEADGSGSRRIDTSDLEPYPFDRMVGWGGPAAFYAERDVLEAGGRQFGRVHPANGNVELLVDGPYLGSAVDPLSGTALVVGVYDDTGREFGSSELLFRSGEVNPIPVATSSQGDLYQVAWSAGLGEFLVAGNEDALAISSSGAVRAFPGMTCLPDVSPDGQWILFAECGGTLFARDGRQIGAIDVAGGHQYVWLPDSSGILYLWRDPGEYSFSLRRATVPDGEVRTVLPAGELDWGLRLVEGPGNSP